MARACEGACPWEWGTGLMGACSAGAIEACPGGCSPSWAVLELPPALTDGARDPRMPDPGDVPVIAVPRNARLLTASSLHAVVGMVSVDTLNLLDCCPAVLCPSRPLLLLPLPSQPRAAVTNPNSQNRHPQPQGTGVACVGVAWGACTAVVVPSALRYGD